MAEQAEAEFNLRDLNDQVALLILLKAGIVMHRAELPQEHLRG